MVRNERMSGQLHVETSGEIHTVRNIWRNTYSKKHLEKYIQ